MTPSRSTFFFRVVMAMMALALVVYAIIGLFTRMMADDYCTAATGISQGAWGGMVQWYQNWSGNFTNFFVKSLIAPLQPALHPFLPGAMIVLLFVALAWLLNRILTDIGVRSPRKASLTLTLLLLFTAYSSAVSRQPLYWMGGLIPYSFPAVLVVFNIGLVWRLRIPRPAGEQALIAILVAILVFLTAGFSETYATFQVTLLVLAIAGIALYAPPERKRAVLVVLSVVLVAAAAGLLLSVLSPGNAARQLVQIYHPVSLPGLVVLVPLFTTLLFVAESFGVANFIFIYFATVAGVLWWYAPPNDAELRSLPPTQHLLRWAVLAVIAAFLLVAAMVTPPVYGAGIVSSRTLYMARLVQLALFAFLGYLTALVLARQRFPGPLAGRPVYRLVRIAVMFLIIVMPVMALARQGALLPDVSRYAAGWDARQVQILAAKARGDEKIIVPPLAYDFEDYLELEKPFSEADANWVNSCLGSYYGIPVYIEPD